MTTTTSRAAMARLQALPWANYARRTAAGLQLCWAVAQVLALAIALAWDIAYQHRAQIRSALVTAAAIAYISAEETYRAGCWCRVQLLALADRSAELLPSQPLPVIAPITAGLQAVREALERLIARLYPAAA